MTENFSIRGHLVPCHDTKAECEARIADLENAHYYLRHGEAGRPTLSPRYVIRDGKRRYYVHAEWNFYAGTFGIPKDGPYERAE